MTENVNLKIYESLEHVFNNTGMRLNHDKFREYLEYTAATNDDITYEEYLGYKPKVRGIDADTISKGMDVALKGLAVLQKIGRKR